MIGPSSVTRVPGFPIVIQNVRQRGPFRRWNRDLVFACVGISEKQHKLSGPEGFSIFFTENRGRKLQTGGRTSAFTAAPLLSFSLVIDV